MEIYYRKSTDGGAHWTAGRRLTWTSGLTQNPALAVDSSGNIHVVWDNNGSGNAEIYYKKAHDSCRRVAGSRAYDLVEQPVQEHDCLEFSL